MCMSYSELGNFEFFILLLIFVCYLLFLTLQKPTEKFEDQVISFIKNKGYDVISDKEHYVGQEDVFIPEEASIKIVTKKVNELFTKVKSMYNEVQKFPSEIKRRFGSELDYMIANVIPKTPSGDYVELTSIDQYFCNDPKNTNPSYTKQIATEYMLIDKLFRDMRMTNIENYKRLFYPGN